jgi:hypothetical protein
MPPRRTFGFILKIKGTRKCVTASTFVVYGCGWSTYRLELCSEHFTECKYYYMPGAVHAARQISMFLQRIAPGK